MWWDEEKLNVALCSFCRTFMNQSFPCSFEGYNAAIFNCFICDNNFAVYVINDKQIIEQISEDRATKLCEIFVQNCQT